ncbi:uncharacterized protein MYCGRDRAFT_97990 [Zymoseptoria tritici IPO323]|uniref:Uncharacterized protein n=1 Tax=Zymoseptoria tritici (strain CBS 115943 / IPO323) TaxID=336722 RepID=F9XS00_ZYMTI|nr:uncharacterized protein MYCGRDRAFT_97990 [Zymoseptoria tritici IPO323]EGP82009.1 hypothetical protein MYCGRDRAFT_97990 [Zymoseptoria tritici IPO323]
MPANPRADDHVVRGDLLQIEFPHSQGELQLRQAPPSEPKNATGFTVSGVKGKGLRWEMEDKVYFTNPQRRAGMYDGYRNISARTMFEPFTLSKICHIAASFASEKKMAR